MLLCNLQIFVDVVVREHGSKVIGSGSTILEPQRHLVDGSRHQVPVGVGRCVPNVRRKHQQPKAAANLRKVTKLHCEEEPKMEPDKRQRNNHAGDGSNR